MQRGQDWGAGLLYAVLLNMKHLYVYCAPLYFVYILRHWCFPPSSAAAGGSSPSVTSSAQPGKKKGKGRKGGSFLRSVGRLIIMGATVVAVCTASLGPFVKLGQVPQVCVGDRASSATCCVRSLRGCCQHHQTLALPLTILIRGPA
jgi:alpha-1,3-glucosyltransferase